MLEIRQLSFSYPQTDVFNETSLSIKRNQITVIQGESGIGKSTLLDILYLKYGLFFDLIYDGQMNDESHQHDYLRHIYYVKSDPVLCEDLTLSQQWQLLSDLYHHDVNEVDVELLGLEGLKKSYPSSLSGGEKQRAALIVGEDKDIHPLFLLHEKKELSSSCQNSFRDMV